MNINDIALIACGILIYVISSYMWKNLFSVRMYENLSMPPSHDWYTHKPSGWRCELFGASPTLIITPREGQVPNAFWRWMQFICFGNKWIKEDK